MQCVRPGGVRMGLTVQGAGRRAVGVCRVGLKPERQTAVTVCVPVRTVRPLSSAVASAGSGSTSRLSGSGEARAFRDLPGPGGPPYFGTYFKYKLGIVNPDKLFDVVTGWHRQFGAVFREVCLGNTVVHIADPDAFRAVYNNDGKRPRIEPLSEPTQRYRQQKGISLGLGNSNDEEWYQLRSAAQRLMMRPRELRPFLPAADAVAREFVSHLKGSRGPDNQVPDFDTQLGRWSLESSGVHCFSRRLGYLTEGGRKEVEGLLSANRLQFELFRQLFASLPLYQATHIATPTWRKLFAAEDHLYSVFLEHFNTALEQLKAKMAQGDLADDLEDGEGFRFLRYMLSREELSLKEVAIITHSLLYDPLSTIKSQLHFLLYLLATHPQAQDRLHQEIVSLTPPGDPCLSPHRVQGMNYFRACFRESVRLMPMINENKRVLQKDLVLGGYHIPAASVVYVNHFALYRDPSYFSEPDSFVPERWLTQETEQKIDPIIVQPFGVGPRMCIGRRFAEQDMAVLVTRLLQTFQLEWNHPPMGVRYQILNLPDRPPQFTLLDR